MDARPLHVLEQPRNEHVRAVGDRVDVHLHALEVTVDPDRPIRVDHGGHRQLTNQVRRRVGEVDGQAADDEAGPDDDRIADPLGQGQRLVDAVGHATFWLGDPQAVQQRGKAAAVLALVDRLQVCPEQPDAGRGQTRGQVERRLAAELDEGRQETRAWRRLRLDDAQYRLLVEWFEIEPARGIEVGRDRLRVRVDHDGLPAQPTERFRGLHRAVVKLDPLPDPDGA